MQNVIFSGIQPTGNLHIGNYLGAIENWRVLISKENSQFFFSIVDLHAITVQQNPQELQNSILSTFATYLACGIKGRNVTVFQQSFVKEHCELAWILGCNVQIGKLDRMTQYKEKTAQHKERACLGLYSYPVLMAADILLYNTTIVPVGEDQTQHIELTRDIAQTFNAKYGEVFTIPKAVLTKAKRVMSLRDGTKKMSKSDESDFSRINLLDSPDLISQKIKKAKTGGNLTPEAINLKEIYEAFSEVPSCHNLEESSSAFKNDLTEVIIYKLAPIQKEYQSLMQNLDFLKKEMKKNGENAQAVAEKNMRHIKDVIGVNV